MAKTLRLISARFMPQAKHKPPKGINNAFWIKSLTDNTTAPLPRYVSVLSQLDACGSVVPELVKLRAALSEGNKEAIFKLWNQITHLQYSNETAPSLCELSEKYGAYGPSQLEAVISELAKLSSKRLAILWENAGRSPLCVYLLPKIVDRKIKMNKAESAQELIVELSKHCKGGWDVQAINLALSVFLQKQKFTADQFISLLRELDPMVKPRLSSQVPLKLAKFSRPDLVRCFEFLIERSIPMNGKGWSSFLRSVFTASDAGASMVIKAVKAVDYSPGFYHFLVRHLTNTRDLETLNWLFENPIMNMATNDPKKLPFVLHMLVLRTIATDGVQATIPILEKMDKVSEPTWMRLFQEFRRLGRVDKCNDTILRALKQGHKLSLPFVGEYLEMVASFHNVNTYLQCLVTLIPEMEPTLKKLGISKWAAGEQLEPVLMPELVLSKEVRDFPVYRLHESWLNITYKTVLNNIDDVTVIASLFVAYRTYAKRSHAAVTLDTTDEFVTRLTRLNSPAALDLAVAIFKESLQSLPLKQVNNGRYNSKGLEALCWSFIKPRYRDLDRIVSLVDDAFKTGHVAVRGQMLAPIIKALEGDDRATVMKEWAQSIGAEFPVPEPKEDLQGQQKDQGEQEQGDLQEERQEDLHEKQDQVQWSRG